MCEPHRSSRTHLPGHAHRQFQLNRSQLETQVRTLTSAHGLDQLRTQLTNQFSKLNGHETNPLASATPARSR
jgi:hypothetical protein